MGRRELVDFVQAHFLRRPEAIVLLLFCLLPSLMPAWINDDSSYYLQSIKWYSEEGWYPGLANLNVRLGLGSSWHALSAVFYWEGIIPDRIWNFNGLLLLLFCMELQQQFPQKPFVSWMTLIFGAPFLNAPSPDLPVALLGTYALVFHRHMKSVDWGLWAFMLIGLKATALPLLLLILIPLISGMWKEKPLWIWPMVALVFCISKNLVLNGYPFFPSAFGGPLTAQAYPAALLSGFTEGVLAEIYGVGFSMEEWRSAGIGGWQRISQLVFLKPYKLIMTVLIWLSAMGMILYYIRNKVGLLPAFAVAGGFLMWLLTAPNYRFLISYVFAAGILLSPKILIRGTIIRHTVFVIPLLGMLAMNTWGLHQVRIIRCGESNKVTWLQLWQPVPYPGVSYTEKPEESGEWNSIVPGGCLYCGNVPEPCYPDTVRSSNRKYGFELEKAGRNFLLKEKSPTNERPDKSAQ